MSNASGQEGKCELTCHLVDHFEAASLQSTMDYLSWNILMVD